ncbi:hypothetical protein BU26DRAFT_97884 [Trematosphaeria pertusa]|uniref:Uncharacterized protein n=1 Tax=Trematosphaeria pertusa TaxID=390896 RepID=A0A6A6I2D5_9PLEO|nr:uncharacterized protein BU26DRAFT_97884 [Trematosphaeria pertusa]KAF2244319.1 hypothetical protein BU26DRAFT_97884 [Trematosphaeria pertusa]
MISRRLAYSRDFEAPDMCPACQGWILSSVRSQALGRLQLIGSSCYGRRSDYIWDRILWYCYTRRGGLYSQTQNSQAIVRLFSLSLRDGWSMYTSSRSFVIDGGILIRGFTGKSGAWSLSDSGLHCVPFKSEAGGKHCAFSLLQDCCSRARKRGERD